MQKCREFCIPLAAENRSTGIRHSLHSSAKVTADGPTLNISPSVTSAQFQSKFHLDCRANGCSTLNFIVAGFKEKSKTGCSQETVEVGKKRQPAPPSRGGLCIKHLLVRCGAGETVINHHLSVNTALLGLRRLYVLMEFSWAASSCQNFPL